MNDGNPLQSVILQDIKLRQKADQETQRPSTTSVESEEEDQSPFYPMVECYQNTIVKHFENMLQDSSQSNLMFDEDESSDEDEVKKLRFRKCASSGSNHGQLVASDLHSSMEKTSRDRETQKPSSGS